VSPGIASGEDDGKGRSGKISEFQVTVRAGKGNVTSGAVGTDKQVPVHAKVAAYVSAGVFGAPMAANSKGMIYKDFRIFEIPPRLERCGESHVESVVFLRTIVANPVMLERKDLPSPGITLTADNCRI
jgi:hypothetical protein